MKTTVDCKPQKTEAPSLSYYRMLDNPGIYRMSNRVEGALVVSVPLGAILISDCNVQILSTTMWTESLFYPVNEKITVTFES